MVNNYNSERSEQVITLERSLMRNVYMWMTVGLTITGIVAYSCAMNGVWRMFSGFGTLILFLATLGIVFYLSANIMRMSPTTAIMAFIGYAGLMGLMLSSIVAAYLLGGGAAILANAFFATAATFAAMSVYGFFTKSNLMGLGRYLMMGLIGLIIATVVNYIVGFFSPAMAGGMSLLISYGGVLLFTILTAYDTQKIKKLAARYNDSDDMTFTRLSIICALELYLDFINLFLFILRIFGGRR